MKANCVVCGKEFEKRGSQKMCSKECYVRRRHDWRAANPEKTREYSHKFREANRKKANCVICGTEYEKRTAAKTCSPECATQKNREKSRKSTCKWRAANPEKHREKSRKYRAKNREKCREYGRKYRATNLKKHRKRCREYQREWRAANPEKAREQDHKYKEANREKIRMRAYERYHKSYAANPQKHRTQGRKYYAANPEKCIKRVRKYYAENTEKIHEYSRDRRRHLRAAKALGIPPLIYTAMKIKGRLTQSQEQPNDQASDQSI